MDSTLLASFEDGTLANETFGHAEHVRVIWEYIHTYGTLGAVERFEAGLKRLTAAAGHPEKYHSTITHVFTFLVGERVAEQGRLDWDSFVDSNPDLFEWPNGQLSKRYPDEVLFSALARQTFVMPPGRTG